MSKVIWKKRDFSKNNSLEKELGVPKLISELLSQRGINDFESAKANWFGTNSLKENLTLIDSNTKFVSYAASYDEILRIHTLFFQEEEMFLTEIQTQAFTGNAQVRAYKASNCD